MTNNEVLNINQMLQSAAYNETAASIVSTKFQYALRRSAKIVSTEAKEIYEALEPLKPEELKEAIKVAAGKPSEELEEAFKKFTAQHDVQELLAIESKIALHTVKLSDLPTDLDGKQMDAVMWLLAEE
jgi:hypothetical protein